MKTRDAKGRFFKGCKSIRKGTRLSSQQCERVRLGRLRYLDKTGYTPKKPWEHTWKGINDRIARSKRNLSRGIHDCYRGVKNQITCEELKVLWFRDKGFLLSRPSIDRKDSKKHYTLKNCQYIEVSENSRKAKHYPEILKQTVIRNWKDPIIREKYLYKLGRRNESYKQARLHIKARTIFA